MENGDTAHVIKEFKLLRTHLKSSLSYYIYVIDISVCANGWSEFGPNCYKIFNKENTDISWSSAENDCIQKGGHLAKISNYKLQSFINKMSIYACFII